ncbi:FxSxx-COOH system tetratricopeptide repeat protein [Kitasatospora sp. NPDC056731]|uniref:FxSxx-COOH system tetratricopeptide repeat protein n=1 Tax=Kitasatospora sp. NPDC056731 TaxID=3155422 RepID=UPI0034323684
MRSQHDLVNSGGVVAGSVRGDIHVHSPTTPPALTWPTQIGTVPTVADCYHHRPSVDRALRTGTATVLSGPQGTGKTQAAAHRAQSALREGSVDLLLWTDASSRTAVRDSYARAAAHLGLAQGPDAATAFLAWLHTTNRRWLLVLDALADRRDIHDLWPDPAPRSELVVTTRSTDRQLRTRRRATLPVRHFTTWESVGYLADRLAVHDLGAPESELTAAADAAGGRPGELCAAADQLIEAGSGPPPHPYGLHRGSVQLRRYVPCPLCAPPAPATGIALRHAPEDEVWARWIEAVLTSAGLGPLCEEADADRTIVLLSTAYLRSPCCADPVEHALVTARIDAASPPASHPSGPTVELTGHRPEQAAAALFAALGGAPRPPDLTGLRYPGTGPAHFKAPPRHLSFTGRSTVLEHLHRQLGGAMAAVLPSSQTLYGLGGIGKTQIALEYAHRFAAEYDLVWWIDAEQPELIGPTLADLARELGLPVGDSVAEAANSALTALRRGTPAARWLLIFDNADDPAEILPFLPGGSGHILVTSRNPEWNRVAEALAVDVFTRRESIEHLRRRVAGLTEPNADAVAHELGDLPLAIEVAAAWLDATGMPVDSYLAQLRSAAAQVLSMGRPVDYPATVAAAWNVSITRLRAEAPAAARLLQLCAFFAPEPISTRLVYDNEQILHALYGERADGPATQINLGAAIKKIGRYSLARVDSTGIQLHRLVQAVIRSTMTAEEQRGAAHDVHLILAAARPADHDIDNPASWPALEEIWPHLTACATHQCDAPQPRQLLIDRVRYLWKRAELHSADRLSETLIPVWTDKLGPDDPQNLRLRFHHANIRRSLGRYTEALTLDEDVLERQRTTLGEHHPDALMTAGSLAADLRGLGRFQPALALDLDTYARLTTLFGADNPRTLAMANNLAIDYRLVGDSQAARDLDQETLQRREAVLGLRHPATLSTKYCLARDLRDLGYFPASIALLSEVAVGFAAVLDPDLPERLRNDTSLAVSLRRAGRLEEARTKNATAYERYRERYDGDTPDALICAANLAADHSAASDHGLARDLTVQIHATYERLLGADHPFTLACAANLALYLRTSGDAEAAIVRGEAAAEALGRCVGPTHPFTLKAVINLANAYTDTGRHDTALPLLQQALADLGARYGTQHPDALACAANLARTLRLLGRPVEAAEHHAHALDGLTRRLGVDHPDTRAARDGCAIDLDLELQSV